MPKSRPRVSAREVSAPEEEWASVPALRQPRYSGSVERGLAILECFTPERPLLGVAEIADGLGMSRSTTHRYLVTLTMLGYLEQGSRHRYRLTLRVSRLGLSALSGTSLQVHVLPCLEELRRRTGFAVSAAVLDGPEVAVVERLPGARHGAHLLEGALPAGARRPAYCTAAGKLLLAGLPEAVLGERLSELTLLGRTPKTITAGRALRSELARIREEGLAAAEEELAEGVYETAAPVRSETGELVAAMGMEAHSSMIPLADLVSALGPHLMSTADALSARLGYRRTDERAGGRLARVAPADMEPAAGGTLV